MDSCRETQARITPYLDGESGEAERRQVQEHLSDCGLCRADAAAQDVARRVLHVRSATLQVKAPETLRARCASLAAAPRRAWMPRWWAWRVLSFGSAAAMGVVVAAFVFGVATHSPVLLAAEMTLDHLKCFALFHPEGGAAPAAPEVEAAVRDRFGWRVSLPPGGEPEDLVLLGARRCLSHDGRVAHLMYRHEGRPVSLFVMANKSHRSADLTLGGYPAHIWTRGDLTYVLVASEADDRLRPVMAYFTGALR
jgi:anti-sigma factor RsiW